MLHKHSDPSINSNKHPDDPMFTEEADYFFSSFFARSEEGEPSKNWAHFYTIKYVKMASNNRQGIIAGVIKSTWTKNVVSPIKVKLEKVKLELVYSLKSVLFQKRKRVCFDLKTDFFSIF